MPNCLFCQIVKNEIAVPRIYEDEQLIVIADKYPKAPVHVLVIPREHIPSLDEIGSQHAGLMAHVMGVLSEVARKGGLKDGFRTIINTGPGGGQEIPHLHVHVLGGGQLPGF
ncbi:MAG: HIT domain-containing protein [Acidiferrobacter sp.]